MIISDHKYSEEISANGEEEGEIFFREQIKGKNERKPFGGEMKMGDISQMSFHSADGDNKVTALFVSVAKLDSLISSTIAEHGR